MTFKGAGFCLNNKCLYYHKPQFYMGMELVYLCRGCHKQGFLERNHTTYKGVGLCRSVKVHFNYEPVKRVYSNIAIVTDDNLPAVNTRELHLYHPFIHHPVSALKLAEKGMADVASGHGGIVFDLGSDDKCFKEALARLANSLRTSKHLRADLGSDFVPLGEY